MTRPMRPFTLLVAMVLAGSVAVVVVATPAEATHPGEPGRVAYTESHRLPNGAYFSEIHTMNPDGSDRRRITFDGGTFVKNHPDLSEPDDPYPVYTASGSPRWSPDGSMLAFSHYTTDDTVEIRIADPFSGNTRVLFSDWTATMPSWSPDGKRIAYADDTGLWVANADGSRATRIATPTLGLWPNGPEMPSTILFVAWSPDGKRIAFDEWTGGGLVAGADYIGVVDVNGSNRRVGLGGRLEGVQALDWSPDGQTLVFDGFNEITTVKPDGSDLDVLAEGASPVWSPVGAKILYRTGAPWLGEGELWSYDVASKTTKRVSADFTGFSMDWQPVPLIPQPVGLVDPQSGVWRLAGDDGLVTTFFFGNPGDFPIMGDWDCDGVDTPGLYRQSDGYVYLKNSNTQGNADVRFFFGNPADIPLAGDFNNNGCDTVSIYRQNEGRVYTINHLGSNDGGLGAADYDYYFGNPGDKPFTGDFNADGTTTVGLHRESSGFVYFRNTNTQGTADVEFFFGDPGDRLIAGDWNHNGKDTVAVYRPDDRTFYLRYTNTQGNADEHFTWGQPHWLPVTGTFDPP